jgi:hypothetical protein
MIERVRGRLEGENRSKLLEFWSEQTGFEGEDAAERVPQVVCLLLGDDGAVRGANSAYAAGVPLLGNRLFWIYRCLLPGDAAEEWGPMVNAAFDALEAEHEPGGEGPVGLLAPIADRERLVREPEVLWPETDLMYAGYLDDATQMRIRYFEGALI